MLKKHSQLFEGLFSASDLLVVSAAWICSYFLRFQSGLIGVEKGIPPFADYLRMLLFVWLIWTFVFRRFGLYRPMRGANRIREVFLVVRANSLCVVLLLAATYLFREKSVPFSRMVFVIFWFVSTILMVGSRSAVRLLLRALRRRGYNLRYALIVGDGKLAARVADRMISHPEFGIELVGCLSADRGGGKFGGVNGLSAKSGYYGVNANAQAYSMSYGAGGLNGRNGLSDIAYGNVVSRTYEQHESDVLPIVGSYEDLPKFLACESIDQVVIALPLKDHSKLEAVVSLIGDSMVDVRIVPDFHHFIQLGSRVEEFDGLPVVSLASTPLSGINVVAKRIFDLIFASILIVLTAPLMALVGLLVKLTSRGPVFFSQERVGLDGQCFNIYKFRTMALDAESKGAQFAVPGDPRVTPIGRFLRQFSIDELPQLFNVLQGHMSLVGPRPERPVFIDEFRRHVPRYMLRHKVQAGMTGWAQVNGWRGNTSIERRIEHDLYYIEHWSLALDLKILGLTLFKGINNSNAY